MATISSILSPPPVADNDGPLTSGQPAGFDETKLLSELVRKFEASEEASMEAREIAFRCRDYYDGKHWTAEELAILRQRRQPAVSVNHIAAKVDFLRGYERKSRTEPEAVPRTPNSDDMALAATQALRFVCDDNDFNELRSGVYDDLLVCGISGIDCVMVDEGLPEGPSIRLIGIPYDRLFYDPSSRRHDFQDARYFGCVIWLDREQAEELYPDTEHLLENCGGQNLGGMGYEDKPANKTIQWADKTGQRVLVVQMHFQKKGEWYQCTFCRGGFLEPPVVSPYKDRLGKSTPSLILRSAWVDRDNNRYSMVKGLLSLQDDINKRLSKAQHLLSVRSVIATKGAVDDIDEARNELAKADGYVEIQPGEGVRFEVSQTTDLAQGQFNLLNHAVSMMQTLGPNASMSGKDPRELSGRAILAQQQGGSIEIEPTLDALRNMSRDVYEAIWMRIRQFWTNERWIRVSKVDGTSFIGLNRKVTLAEELTLLPPDQRAAMMQHLQIQPNDPRLSQVVRIEHPVEDMDVDIKMTDGGDFITLQAEQFAQLAALAQSGVQIPPDVLIAASSLLNKKELLERLQQPQAPDPVKMSMAQAQLAKIAAQTNETNSAAENQRAQAIATMHGIAMDHSGATSLMNAASVQGGGQPGLPSPGGGMPNDPTQGQPDPTQGQPDPTQGQPDPTMMPVGPAHAVMPDPSGQAPVNPLLQGLGVPYSGPALPPGNSPVPPPLGPPGR